MVTEDQLTKLQVNPLWNGRVALGVQLSDRVLACVSLWVLVPAPQKYIYIYM